MKSNKWVNFFLITMLFCYSCSKEEKLTNKVSEEFPGGETTYPNIFSGAFQQPAPNLSSAELIQHDAGDANFSAIFIESPAIKNFGLGSIFNQNSCISCHVKDGRSPQPFSGDDLKGLLFRLSIPGADAHGGPLDVPGFGGQLQNKAVVGTPAEAKVQLSFSETNFTFEDGTPYTLRKPIYTLVAPYIPFPASVMVSPRIGSQVYGLGLLEAIRESDILANEDIADINGDGISGKANKVWNPLSKNIELGRFGWKANVSKLIIQVAGALNQDMGLTSFVFPQESSFYQSQYDGRSDDPEVDSQFVADLTFYTQTLAVPKRRDFNNSSVLKGKQVFMKIGCNKCHTPSYVTGTGISPALNNQTIYPYTDLLLHDMGADLADNRPDFLANGNEWRTPPLWGIGLFPLINGHSNLLHDGRARNVLEAIMWHGGEAEQQKQKVKKLSATEREDLLKFINSL